MFLICSFVYPISLFAHLSVTKLVNEIFWKQMNWFWWKLERTSSPYSKDVKGKDHTMLKIDLQASFSTSLGRVAFLQCSSLRHWRSTIHLCRRLSTGLFQVKNGIDAGVTDRLEWNIGCNVLLQRRRGGRYWLHRRVWLTAQYSQHLTSHINYTVLLMQI